MFRNSSQPSHRWSHQDLNQYYFNPNWITIPCLAYAYPGSGLFLLHSEKKRKENLIYDNIKKHTRYHTTYTHARARLCTPQHSTAFSSIKNCLLIPKNCMKLVEFVSTYAETYNVCINFVLEAISISTHPHTQALWCRQHNSKCE